MLGNAAWSPAQRRLHWWTAALVFAAVPLGFLMVSVPIAALLAKYLLYQLHKTVGIAAFGLVATRLALRAARGRPAWDPSLPERHRAAASVVHALLYVMLLVVPLLGYLAAATAPAEIPTLFLGVIPVPHVLGTNAAWFAVLRQAHLWLALILTTLACGHASAAVHNHWRGRRALLHM